MKKSHNNSIILRSGIACLMIGLFWLLNQWFNIQWYQMRDSFVRALPYILPISLMVIGAILVVRHINRDDD